MPTINSTRTKQGDLGGSGLRGVAIFCSLGRGEAVRFLASDVLEEGGFVV